MKSRPETMGSDGSTLTELASSAVGGVGRLNTGWTALRPGIDRFGRHLHRGAAAYGVLLIALLLTLLASNYVRQNVEAEARTRFEETTQATKAAIYRRVNAYLAAMFGTRGLLRVSGSVEHDEWEGYVRSIEPGLRRNRLRKAQSLEGLQSLGFAKYVRPGERGILPRGSARGRA